MDTTPAIKNRQAPMVGRLSGGPAALTLSPSPQDVRLRPRLRGGRLSVGHPAPMAGARVPAKYGHIH